MIEEGNQNKLFLHFGQSRKSAFAAKHTSHEVVPFTVEPLTHRFFNDVISVNLLVLVHILEQGEDEISSIDQSSEAATHQCTSEAGDPGREFRVSYDQSP